MNRNFIYLFVAVLVAMFLTAVFGDAGEWLQK